MSAQMMMLMMMMMGTPPVMTDVMVIMKTRSDPFWRLMPKGEKEQGTRNIGFRGRRKEAFDAGGEFLKNGCFSSSISLCGSMDSHNVLSIISFRTLFPLDGLGLVCLNVLNNGCNNFK